MYTERVKKTRTLSIPDDELKYKQKCLNRVLEKKYVHRLREAKNSLLILRSSCNLNRKSLAHTIHGSTFSSEDWNHWKYIKDSYILYHPKNILERFRQCLRNYNLMYIKLDLKDFFWSIHPSIFLDSSAYMGIKLEQETIAEIYKTCFHPDRKTLPQGAPTSNIIAEISMYKIDRVLSSLCSGTFDTTPYKYLRYVDDILIIAATGYNTFNLDSLYNKLKNCLANYGFDINVDKVSKGTIPYSTGKTLCNWLGLNIRPGIIYPEWRVDYSDNPSILLGKLLWNLSNELRFSEFIETRDLAFEIFKTYLLEEKNILGLIQHLYKLCGKSIGFNIFQMYTETQDSVRLDIFKSNYTSNKMKTIKTKLNYAIVPFVTDLDKVVINEYMKSGMKWKKVEQIFVSLT